MKPRGTMRFLADNDEERITAYFGSRAAQAAIGDWSTFWPPHPSPEPELLDHGYDETLPESAWDADVLLGVAMHRGGELLTPAPIPGAVATPIQWKCGLGHTFSGSPRLILTAGHWCPVCVTDPVGYPDQAEHNNFLAQLERTPAAKVAQP